MTVFYTFYDGEIIMNSAFIQHQDRSGNWVQVSMVPNESVHIIQGMQRASDLYNGGRVRAVDSDGRVLDIL